MEDLDIMDDVQHAVTKLETLLPTDEHSKVLDSIFLGAVQDLTVMMKEVQSTTLSTE